MKIPNRLGMSLIIKAGKMPFNLAELEDASKTLVETIRKSSTRFIPQDVSGHFHKGPLKPWNEADNSSHNAQAHTLAPLTDPKP